MAETKIMSKRTLQYVLSDIGDRKLVIMGPNNQKLQDSRFSVQESAQDHVAIKLLGEDVLIIPHTAITSIKFERLQLTINHR